MFLHSQGRELSHVTTVEVLAIDYLFLFILCSLMCTLKHVLLEYACDKT